jgi:nucleotide-binding universal stress UspA family protein
VSADTHGVEALRGRIVVCVPPRAGAARTLTRLAEGAELIVVGNRCLGTFASLVARSVSQQCAHDASCPVMIVPVPRP